MKNKVITIDLTKSEIFTQIENASKKINKKPWYKRLLSWF